MTPVLLHKMLSISEVQQRANLHGRCSGALRSSRKITVTKQDNTAEEEFNAIKNHPGFLNQM